MKQLTELPPQLEVPASDADGGSDRDEREPSWTFDSHYASQIDIINEKYRDEIDQLIATDPVLKAKQQALDAAEDHEQAQPHPRMNSGSTS